MQLAVHHKGAVACQQVRFRLKGILLASSIDRRINSPVASGSHLPRFSLPRQAGARIIAAAFKVGRGCRYHRQNQSVLGKSFTLQKQPRHPDRHFSVHPSCVPGRIPTLPFARFASGFNVGKNEAFDGFPAPTINGYPGMYRVAPAIPGPSVAGCWGRYH